MSFDIPYELKDAIKNNKILIFVGAGLSKAVGLPLWKEIVIKVLDNPSVEKGASFKKALNDGIITPLYVLDAIKERNKRDVYRVFEEFTSVAVQSELHKSIAAIGRKIITTNYDNLIESNTGIRAVDISSKFNLQKIDELNEFVLKIHGGCDAIDNAIIFTSDYETLYGESGLAKFQLQKLISSHSCLFVGFSLTDNYVVNLLNYLNDLYDGTGRKHFAVSVEHLPHKFVETIHISSYSEVEDFLKHLSELASENSICIKGEHLDEVDEATINEHAIPLIDSIEGIYVGLGEDTPPKIENWTGRDKELKALNMEHKACFITGIGGQGKSALASRFLADADRVLYKYLDWRDFKEEELNFQSKLYGLIELVASGGVKTSQLIGLDTEVLVDVFFRHLGDQRGIFVFDNIDKYIDLQNFTPAGDMKIFFDKVLALSHSSKFIFTCRPFIHFAGIGSYQIRLEGLAVDDAEDLIAKYHPQLNVNTLKAIAMRMHQCTRGHPLWMGLILAQSRVDINQIDVLLDKIEHKKITEYNPDFSGLVSAIVLEDLWSGLKEREKVVLRMLSISSVAESEEGLSKIVSGKINYNQFSKAIRSLKSLNLIISKEGDGFVELHPLVREFIRKNYGSEEQESYIGLYVSYLDGFIYLLKKKFGKVLQPEDIAIIIKKIEILINAGKTQDAINELRLTSGSLFVSGFSEEYLRLSELLLSGLQWSNKRISGLKGFLEFISTFFTRAAYLRRNDIFDKYMYKYTDVYQIPDTHMILSKSALSHRAWIAGNFSEAIREGKSAADLIDVLGEEDIWSGKHTLNLALRDSKEPENVGAALRYFSEGRALEDILNDDDMSSSKLGNIGRCLLYQNNVELAHKFICKSYVGFMRGGLGYLDSHNLGYASKWIGEGLRDAGKIVESLYFYLHSRNLWKKDMPEEANKIDYYISQMPVSVATQSVVSLESWQVSKYCDDWVKEQLE